MNFSKLLIFIASFTKKLENTAYGFIVLKTPSLFVHRTDRCLRAWLTEFMLQPEQTREQKSTQPCDHHLYRLGVILDSFTLNKTTPNGLSLIVESPTPLCAHTFSPFRRRPKPEKNPMLKIHLPGLPSQCSVCQCVNLHFVYCSGIPRQTMLTTTRQPDSRRINSEILCPILTHIKLP